MNIDIELAMNAIDHYIAYVEREQATEGFDPRRVYLIDCLNEVKEDIIERYLQEYRCTLFARYID